MRAGTGRRTITPPIGVWMAGYASRTRPAEDVADDLIVKALAIEDRSGKRTIVITADIIEWHPSINDAVRAALRGSYPDLSREDVLFTASHTHSGPIVDPTRTTTAPDRFPAEYVAQLVAKTVEAATDALESMRPASATLHRGSTTLGIHRRKMVNGQIQMLPNPDVSIYRELAALRVERSGAPPVVLFSIACHPTTLSWYQFSGDYPGFAQRGLEANLGDGSQAMFCQGACGDVRVNVVTEDRSRFQAGTYEQARTFGETLRDEVLTALESPGEPVELSLDTRMSRIDLPLQGSKSLEELRAIADKGDPYLRAWAEPQIAAIEAGGAPPSSAELHAHWLRLSDNAQIIALGGEVCGGIAEAVRGLFPGHRTLVLAYAEDVLAYIPTRQIIEEGGYEGDSSQLYYLLPAPFSLDMPDRLLDGVRALVSVARSPR
ncbi:hypothetical protein FJZ36_00465 [Candidatus Poribacteria bacterium]|nr:hypothetical protein [Candidatus Poribacteria bacterium]